MPNHVDNNPALPTVARSQALLDRALDVIPCATQTLAKGPTMFVRGVSPVFLQRGKGARVFDVDDNEYLDMILALGPVSLGYTHPVVDAAIRDQLAQGISFSQVHPLEVEVAERVRELVPCAEMVRFSKTGADATSAAIRLSRAHTGRDKVLSCGYHGWHDFHAATMDRFKGVPDAVRALTRTFPYDDLATFERLLDRDTACVILEPVAFQLPSPDFLARVRELCTERGAMLIFDEMWTGFRVALGGAQSHFGVTPDLACFSKAIANGMPLSVVCGRADVMRHCEGDIFFFTTFGGETLSLAAALATMAELERHSVPDHMRVLGERLMTGIQSIANKHGLDYVGVTGLPCRSALTLTPEGVDPVLAKSFVQQELIRRGVLWNGFHALCASHTGDDIEYLTSAYADILPALDRAARDGESAVRAALEGLPIGSPLRTGRTGRTGRTEHADGK